MSFAENKILTDEACLGRRFMVDLVLQSDLLDSF